MANEVTITIRAKSLLGRAIQDAKAQFKDLGSSIKSALGGALGALGVGLSAAGLVAFGKSVIDLGDKIADTSKKMQTSFADFQFLNWAAERSGTSIESVQVAYKKMSDTISDAKNKSTAAIAVLSRLGLTLADVDGKSTAEQFRMVAKAINDLPAGGGRIAALSDIFGRGGMDLGVLIQDLDSLEGKFKGLQGAMSDDAVRAADAYKDSITDLTTAMQALAANTGFISYLSQSAEGLALIASSTDKARMALRGVLDIQERAGKFGLVGFAAKAAGKFMDKQDMAEANSVYADDQAKKKAEEDRAKLLKEKEDAAKRETERAKQAEKDRIETARKEQEKANAKRLSEESRRTEVTTGLMDEQQEFLKAAQEEEKKRLKEVEKLEDKRNDLLERRKEIMGDIAKAAKLEAIDAKIVGIDAAIDRLNRVNLPERKGEKVAGWVAAGKEAKDIEEENNKRQRHLDDLKLRVMRGQHVSKKGMAELKDDFLFNRAMGAAGKLEADKKALEKARDKIQDDQLKELRKINADLAANLRAS